MEIKTFYFNPLRECCYIAWDETRECVIVDPGNYTDYELERLKDFVSSRQLKPVKILLTHGHFDHVLGLQDVARTWNLDAWMHPEDRSQLLSSGAWCAQLGLDFHPFTGQFHDLADGDRIHFGHSVLKVLSTPGHTQGGVCFLDEEDGVLFSGDTLFAGSIGRTDHLGGNYDQLIDSLIRKILPLDGNTTVFPGHGGSTSIGYERATNPFLQDA